MNVTALSLAERFLGLEEVEGHTSNPQILAMLRLDQKWPAGDDVAWCSALVNYIAWLLDLPRSHSLGARSWLKVGTPVSLTSAVGDVHVPHPLAEPGFDVVILKRGTGNQPGPEVTDAPGHVGFFVGLESGGRVKILGGNQSDMVSVASYPVERVLGVRRLI